MLCVVAWHFDFSYLQKRKGEFVEYFTIKDPSIKSHHFLILTAIQTRLHSAVWLDVQSIIFFTPDNDLFKKFKSNLLKRWRRIHIIIKDPSFKCHHFLIWTAIQKWGFQLFGGIYRASFFTVDNDPWKCKSYLQKGKEEFIKYFIIKDPPGIKCASKWLFQLFGWICRASFFTVDNDPFKNLIVFSKKGEGELIKHFIINDLSMKCNHFLILTAL